MKVSVIIPNYNHSNYLDQRIKSVLEQTYRNFEVIILDDCSNDNSREVIETFRSQPGIGQIIYNDKNSGSTFAQWQKGIDLAKGDLIWIAESDDWCEPNFLENLVPAFQNPKCVLAFTQSLIVYPNGDCFIPYTKSLFDTTVDGLDFVQSKMLLGNEIVNASMAVFRKDVYKKIPDGYLALKFRGDWLFWIQVALQGEVYCSGKVLNYFRKHGNDVSGKSFRQGLFYTEYFNILSSLVEAQVIGQTQRRHLLAAKLQQLVQDTRVAPEVKEEIKRTFKNSLGNSYYNVLAKSHLKKIYQQCREYL